jgi:hypothetical protein
MYGRHYKIIGKCIRRNIMENVSEENYSKCGTSQDDKLKRPAGG